MHTPDDVIAQLRLTHFLDLQGRAIEIDFGQGPVPSEILSATPVGGNTLRPGGGFSVMLRAPVATPAQGVYAIHHPELGVLELMLCPRRQRSGVTEFELVMN